VTHERGQQTNFRCVQLVETGAQTESTSGERAFQQRMQDVVALVLTPLAIAERKTNSRSVECLERIENLSIGVGRAIDRMRRQGVDWIDDVFRSPEYAAAHQFVQEQRTWQVGEYKVECAVYVAGKRHPSTCRFRFVLGDGAVALLNANMAIMEQNFRESLMSPAPGGPAPPRQVHWVWPTALTWD